VLQPDTESFEGDQARQERQECSEHSRHYRGGESRGGRDMFRFDQTQHFTRDNRRSEDNG